MNVGRGASLTSEAMPIGVAISPLLADGSSAGSSRVLVRSWLCLTEVLASSSSSRYRGLFQVKLRSADDDFGSAEVVGTWGLLERLREPEGSPLFRLAIALRLDRIDQTKRECSERCFDGRRRIAQSLRSL